MQQRMLAHRLAPSTGKACAARPLAPCRASRRKVKPASTAQDDAPAEPISRPTGGDAPNGRVLREYSALGGRVVEADGSLPTGGEDAPDFWEGERFENLGKAVERYFLPALVVLGLVCGGIAASSYDDGASVFLGPSSPDSEPTVLLAAPTQQQP